MRVDERCLLAVTVLGVAVTLFSLAIVGQVFPLHGAPAYGADFLNYWAAPRIAAKDIDALFAFEPYMDALRTQYGEAVYEHQWSYPLHSLFFYAPFAALPYLPALLVWTVAGLVAYALVIRMAAPGVTARMLLCMLVSPAVLVSVHSGQNGLLIGAAALGVLLLIEKRRLWLAGVLLGCLTIKPQLFILWPLILVMMGAWRTILAAAVTAGLLVAASVAMHGSTAWEIYLRDIPAMQWQLMHMIPAEAGAYQWMMPGLVPALRLLQVPLSMAVPLQLLLSVGVAVLTLYRLRQPLPFPQKLLVVASASLLVTPYAFNYDMTFLTAALVLCWQANPPRRVMVRWVGGMVFLLPGWIYLANLSALPLAPVVLLLVLYNPRLVAGMEDQHAGRVS